MPASLRLCVSLVLLAAPLFSAAELGQNEFSQQTQPSSGFRKLLFRMFGIGTDSSKPLPVDLSQMGPCGGPFGTTTTTQSPLCPFPPPPYQLPLTGENGLPATNGQFPLQVVPIPSNGQESNIVPGPYGRPFSGQGPNNGGPNFGQGPNNGGPNSGQWSNPGQGPNFGQGPNNGGSNPGQGPNNGGSNPGQGPNNEGSNPGQWSNPGQGPNNGGPNPGQGSNPEQGPNNGKPLLFPPPPYHLPLTGENGLPAANGQFPLQVVPIPSNGQESNIVPGPYGRPFSGQGPNNGGPNFGQGPNNGGSNPGQWSNPGQGPNNGKPLLFPPPPYHLPLTGENGLPASNGQFPLQVVLIPSNGQESNIVPGPYGRPFSGQEPNNREPNPGQGPNNGVPNFGQGPNNGGSNPGQGPNNGGSNLGQWSNPGQGPNNGGSNPGQGPNSRGPNPGQGPNNGVPNFGQGPNNGGSNPGQGPNNGGSNLGQWSNPGQGPNNGGSNPGQGPNPGQGSNPGQGPNSGQWPNPGGQLGELVNASLDSFGPGQESIPGGPLPGQNLLSPNAEGLIVPQPLPPPHPLVEPVPPKHPEKPLLPGNEKPSDPIQINPDEPSQPIEVLPVEGGPGSTVISVPPISPDGPGSSVVSIPPISPDLPISPGFAVAGENPGPNNEGPLPGQGPNNGGQFPGQGPNNGRPLPGQGPNNGRPLPGQEPNNGRPLPGQGLNNGRPLPGQEPNNGRPLPGQGPNNGRPLPFPPPPYQLPSTGENGLLATNGQFPLQVVPIPSNGQESNIVPGPYGRPFSGQGPNNGGPNPGQWSNPGQGPNNGGSNPGQWSNPGQGSNFGQGPNNGGPNPGQWPNNGGPNPGQWPNNGGPNNGGHNPGQGSNNGRPLPFPPPPYQLPLTGENGLPATNGQFPLQVVPIPSNGQESNIVPGPNARPFSGQGPNNGRPFSGQLGNTPSDGFGQGAGPCQCPIPSQMFSGPLPCSALRPFIPSGFSYASVGNYTGGQLGPIIPNESPCTVLDALERVGAKRMRQLIINSGIDLMLIRLNGYTLFAPVDIAFYRLPNWFISSLETDQTLRQAFVLNHLVKDDIPLREMHNEYLILNDRPGGNRIRFNVYFEEFESPIYTVDGARIVRGDILASNGRIHLIDKVIMPSPPRNAAEYLSEKVEFEGFWNAVKNTNLEVFQSDRPITVFIPLTEAVERIDMKDFMNDPGKLSRFISYHVVNGTYYSSGLINSEYLTTNLYKEIKVGVQSDGFSKLITTINGHIHVVKADIPLLNGVAHIISDCIADNTAFYLFDESDEFVHEYGVISKRSMKVVGEEKFLNFK